MSAYFRSTYYLTNFLNELSTRDKLIYVLCRSFERDLKKYSNELSRDDDIEELVTNTKKLYQSLIYKDTLKPLLKSPLKLSDISSKPFIYNAMMLENNTVKIDDSLKKDNTVKIDDSLKTDNPVKIDGSVKDLSGSIKLSKDLAEPSNSLGKTEISDSLDNPNNPDKLGNPNKLGKPDKIDDKPADELEIYFGKWASSFSSDDDNESDLSEPEAL